MLGLLLLLLGLMLGLPWRLVLFHLLRISLLLIVWSAQSGFNRSTTTIATVVVVVLFGHTVTGVWPGESLLNGFETVHLSVFGVD